MLRSFGLFAFVIVCYARVQPAGFDSGELHSYPASGRVVRLDMLAHLIVIQHGAISNYMPAMTMPFKVKDPAALRGVHLGDRIAFVLNVTQTESWISGLTKLTGGVEQSEGALPVVPLKPASPAASASILDYKFTNEVGQGISLHDFRGQAIAITFFYTRCPLPEYCPRLSKNFQQAAALLNARANAPKNWHLLSFSFDCEHDTPAILKAYGKTYGYDPQHWSFLTGPADKLAQLAKGSGASYEADGVNFNHNFRTLIIDASGHLQMIFPMAGDISAQIADELVKAAAVNVAQR